MKFSEGIQKAIPFGYLFLIILGIFKEGVMFFQIGVNILKYSTITDILISPIVDLASFPVILILLIVLIAFSYYFPAYLSKKRDKEWVKRLSGLNGKGELDNEGLENHYTNLFVKFMALTLFSFFVGIGLGKGLGLSRRIKEDVLEYKTTLNFSSGEAEQVYLINSNSLYYFYLKKGNKNIKIAPIGAIKSVELPTSKEFK
ncbi:MULTISPECIES: hypothetical protein [unclassified Arcicella]|uniref:hypothetical protein n=1 Tax=unclassified Arcicella TaxID=2644986 RepID=UPI0028589CA0|nr:MULTISPECIES: hypothetical protein [unclassified Arcicella]MDR6561844.1 hypothetical protein [Arcicella sp. BE51]MDR6813990.1 hypothetical protein [Arcicella sp. BE140]MDR6825303.1 hypothetical protein [Arcicella sp. BE139]